MKETKNEENLIKKVAGRPVVWKDYVLAVIIIFLPFSVMQTALKIFLGVSGVLLNLFALWGTYILAEKMAKNDPLWKKIVGIIYIITFIILAIVFNMESPKITNKGSLLIKTDKNIGFSELSGNLYRNTKYNFRIKFPEGWEIKPGDGSNILQKAEKGGNSINIMVLEIPTGYVSEPATIKDVMSLTEFKNGVIKEMQQKFPDSILLDYGETKLDNISAYWTKMLTPYSVLDKNVRGILLQYQLLNKNIFYIISTGGPENEFKNAEQELNKSVETFVIEGY